ncbi:hypothetical protein ACFXGA_10120 [Actinosynnema sp. NPDC059335]|uniref:hypothetical protein n=1 Tax=Actinosynnema sp. NPDC059335 TaxID=3346804 RepID=UPI00366C1311
MLKRVRILLGALAIVLLGVVSGGSAAQATTGSDLGNVGVLSAEVCTGNAGLDYSVCVIVRGTGLHVDYIGLTRHTNVAAYAPWTDYGKISIGNNIYYYQSTYVTGQRTQRIEVGTNVGLDFADGMQVCGNWNGWPGKRPCATIHS